MRSLKDLLQDLVANKGRQQNSGAAGGQIHLQHVVNFSQAKFRQIVRKEQPVACQACVTACAKRPVRYDLFLNYRVSLVIPLLIAPAVSSPANMNEAFPILQIMRAQPVRDAARFPAYRIAPQTASGPEPEMPHACAPISIA